MERWDAGSCGRIATILAGSILLAQTPQQKAWSILELATLRIFCHDELSTCVGKSVLSMGTRPLACPVN